MNVLVMPGTEVPAVMTGDVSHAGPWFVGCLICQRARRSAPIQGGAAGLAAHQLVVHFPDLRGSTMAGGDADPT